MEKLRQWIAFTVVAVLVLVVGGWFLVISPKRSQASDIRQQAAAQVSANDVLRTQITLLKAQAKSLPQKQAQLAAVAAKIPDNPALPALIRDLTAAADDAGVELVSMAPGQPTPVVDPTKAGTTGSTTTRTTTSSSKTSTSGSRAAAQAAAAAGMLKSITLSLNVVGGYFQVEQFFDRLESLSRAMKVASLSMAPGSNPLKVVPAGPAGAAPSTVDTSTLVANIAATVYMATGRTTTALPGK